MKRNALTRVILWSIVLALLSAALLYCLIGSFMLNRNTAASAASPVVSNVNILYPRIVTEDVNVRETPDPNSIVVNFLPQGTWVDVTQEEAVNGTTWCLISNPITGWVSSQYLSEPVSSESASAAEANEYAFLPDQVQDVEIEWVSGSITIEAADTDQILIYETEPSESKYRMVCKHRNGKLSIEYSENENHLISIGNASNFEKDLTVRIPRDWNCRSLEISAASANVEANGLTAEEVEIESASGTCDFRDSVVGNLSVETASGDIRYTGTLHTLDCDAASANILAVLNNTPKRIKMDTMSGKVDVTLPEDTGFTLTMDGLSTDFTSDFETLEKNGEYICGDGRCRIVLNSLSGDVFIRKVSQA